MDEDRDDVEDEGTIGDGIHEVGIDIEPGQYKTDGPDEDSFVGMCHYQRNTDGSGDFDAMITNNNIDVPGSFTIEDGEFLELSGDGVWEWVD